MCKPLIVEVIWALNRSDTLILHGILGIPSITVTSGPALRSSRLFSPI